VTYAENHIQAADTAQQAMSLMQAHGIPPHPQNFEIWFNYVSGRNPDLQKTIDDLIDSGDGFTGQHTDELYAQFFSIMAEGIQVSEAATLLDDQLQRLMVALNEADGNTQNFGTALAEFTGALQSGGEGDLRVALAQVANATAEMRSRNSTLENQLEDSVGEIRQLRDDLDTMRHEAFTDALTGIANRKMFDHELMRLATDSQEPPSDLCLLMLDIDHFKQFNDNFGHQVGDQVLKLLAATVKECVKGRDIPARYGGEEFSVILPETDLQSAVTLAEQIRQAIGSKKVVNKQTNQDLGRITVSIGAGHYVAGEPLRELIRRADEAMYLAKNSGRNRVASETSINHTGLSDIAETG
jgi:diguanylate cyclase